MISTQIWNDCDEIQDVVSVEMEPLKPNLWILDKGNAKCLPKIVSYSLTFENISKKTELNHIDGKNLNTMIIDPLVDPELGLRAYIGTVEDNVLLVFSLQTLQWFKLRLSESSLFSSPVRADFLTISKVSPELFITGKDELDVFSINLELMRKIREPSGLETKEISLMYNTTFRGKKLGRSTGIESDRDSGLIYFIIRDYVIVRWDTRHPLKAEYHQVFIQSYEIFPYVSRFFTDSEEAIWALVNPMSPENCASRNETEEHVPKLDKRVVRLLKYVKFTNKKEMEKMKLKAKKLETEGNGEKQYGSGEKDEKETKNGEETKIGRGKLGMNTEIEQNSGETTTKVYEETDEEEEQTEGSEIEEETELETESKEGEEELKEEVKDEGRELEEEVEDERNELEEEAGDGGTELDAGERSNEESTDGVVEN